MIKPGGTLSARERKLDQKLNDIFDGEDGK